VISPAPVVDPERLHRILRRITDDLAVLRRYAAMPAEDVRRDPAPLGHVKYLFVTALEGCIDAAQHVCASEGYGPPATNADAVALLGEHTVLEDNLAAVMRQAVGFRNVLGHGYADFDDERVLTYLGERDDLERYVDALARLLDDAAG
jgi:uncharacterized protein YutE (UPF0331/DUF86 family)